MNVFQMVVVPIIVILFLERIVAFFRGEGPRRTALFWGLIWLVAGVSITWPQLTSTIAQFVGIDRGADLVIYCAIIFMFVGFSATYLRMRRMESSITQLVRQTALENPILPDAEHISPRRESNAPDAPGNRQ